MMHVKGLAQVAMKFVKWVLTHYTIEASGSWLGISTYMGKSVQASRVCSASFMIGLAEHYQGVNLLGFFLWFTCC